MPIKRAGIPSVDNSVDPKIRQILVALKENVEISAGMRGQGDANQENWTRRSVTLGMLIKLGVLTEEEARSVWQDP